MGVADTVIVVGSCKIQPCSFFNRNNYSKSTKFQIPKSLRFVHPKPSSNLRQLHCSSPRFSLGKFKDTDGFTFAANLLNQFLYDKLPQQLLSVMVALDDEDEHLRLKFDDLARKETFEIDVKKKANIVLDEVVPLLLENAGRWISSRFTVSSNLEESFDKLREAEEVFDNKLTLEPGEEDGMMGTLRVEVDAINTIRCTKVYVDVSIVGEIDDKFKEIQTREDLKALLNHLMSMESVRSASALCVRLLMSKKELEDSFLSTN